MKTDGTFETWDETVDRVVEGNCALVPSKYIEKDEKGRLKELIREFKIIPAGRHLYMSGVEGRQFLYNCWASGWTPDLSDHFTFTFLRLMEGGGVGANYSHKHMPKYPIKNLIRLHFFCEAKHPDYEKINEYLHDWKDWEEFSFCDFVPDSREGWADSLKNVIDHASGNYCYMDCEEDEETGVKTYHIAIDVSEIRSEGSPIKTFGGTAAGPLPLIKMLLKVQDILNECWITGLVQGPDCMEIDHAIAECVVSGNVRRSARMSIMSWDDPWIDWFLTCKSDTSDHWSTNISVEIDNEFINLIKAREEVLTVPDIRRALHAEEVYDAVLEGMLKNGEPGFVNASLHSEGELEPFYGTNPCSEITLEPWEACNLGHVNLAAFVNEDGTPDYDGLHEAHRLVTRFLIRATYGDVNDSKSREVLGRNRRIGVGHLGYQWFCNLLGIKYSQSHREGHRALPQGGIATILRQLRWTVGRTAHAYSFQLRIPEPIKTTTVAPTGTIAKLCGVSEGIHPIYAKHFIRRIRFTDIDPNQKEMLDEYKRLGYEVEDCIYSPNTKVVSFPSIDPLVRVASDRGISGDIVESVDEISLTDMLSVQAMYQKYWADNSVSFTVNFPQDQLALDELRQVMLDFLPKLKGTTLMPDGSRPQSPYERISSEDFLTMESMVGSSSESSVSEECARGACPIR